MLRCFVILQRFRPGVDLFHPQPNLAVLQTVKIFVGHSLTLYPLKGLLAPLKYNIFENIMENGAFALFEQMLHFPYFKKKQILHFP